MADIKFSKDETEILVKKIKLYFIEELDQDIAQFDAQFLLDFFTEEIGPYFYNKGLYDAQAILEAKIESITDGFYEIEKPTEFSR
ncbi:MAG: DUF2164 domain-containing protein [Cellvibrionaceae bacterium]